MHIWLEYGLETDTILPIFGYKNKARKTNLKL